MNLSYHNCHQPVLLAEVIEVLAPQPGEVVVDATVGLGGHAKALLPHLMPGGHLIGLDQDGEALEQARHTLARWGDHITLFQRNYAELSDVLHEAGKLKVHKALIDCGVSSYQLETDRRGFSFQVDGPLDMRMDERSKVTARDLVNGYSEAKLATLFYELGEEREARRIAEVLVTARKIAPIDRTLQLAAMIDQAVRRHAYRGRIKVKARVFQALRMAVNNELESLRLGLRKAVDALLPQGRLAVITFHSLEDRLVKYSFKERVKEGEIRLWNKHVIRPGHDEVMLNARARSAKLRVVEKCG